MQTVGRMTVENHAGFDLSFHVEGEDGKPYGSESPSYPSGGSHTMSLEDLDISKGTAVRPRIKAHVGGDHTKEGPSVRFEESSDNATYRVSGGYLNISVTLV